MPRIRLTSGLLLVIAAALAVLAYWTGLDGPFIFDDYANFKPIPEWLAGRQSLSRVLFDTGGGLFGRPVSMASFALNAKLSGYTPHAFKLWNLGLHLLIGALVYGLLRRLISLDASLRARAPALAAASAALWILHPLQASTVLYSVQRMAQLSALTVLLGLWFYVAMRRKIAEAPSRLATASLFVGITALTALGFLAKENGALLPLLCCVVEVAYFPSTTRPKQIKAFLGIFGLGPMVAAVAVMALPHNRFLAGYIGRDFSMAERLLTQGRVLCDYVVQLLVPNPARMGIFNDDFPVSTGLLTPWTTLAAFGLIALVTWVAWRARKQAPTITFGWLFFLAAHALEASFIPLEIYFEHRNYLPSVGLLAAVVGALWFAAARARSTKLPAILSGALVCTLLVFTVAAHGRALVWKNSLTIATAGLLNHPQSLYANSYVLMHNVLFKDEVGANRVIERLLASPRPRNRALGLLYRVYAGCAIRGKADADDLATFAATTPIPVTIPENQAFYSLYNVTQKQPCVGLSDSQIGAAIRQVADRAAAERSQLVRILRYESAAYFARGNDWANAKAQGELAWDQGAPANFAIPLIEAHLREARPDRARDVLVEAKRRADPSNQAEVEQLRQIEDQVRQVERAVREMQR